MPMMSVGPLRISVGAAIVAAIIGSPAALTGWGLDVHRAITERAIDGLPEPLAPFFAARKAFVAEHSVDPDLWRIVDLSSPRGEEDPNHFLDIDGLDEPRPFTKVPRTWEAYVTRYGAERANRMGRLPWRTEEIYRMLVGRFQEAARNPLGYGAENAAYLSAVLAHYIEDAHVPFHAVVNYDGQATKQRGIHSRFESELPVRFREALALQPVRIKPIPNVRDFVFETLVSGEALVEGILAADRAATSGRETYDDAYFTAFFKAARRTLERRYSDAASGVASVIVAAWTEAGKPALPVRIVRPPAPIRR
jgi:hypothetical protein